jgi:Fic family protein
MQDVALWLKSLVLVRPAVIQAYRENPRPVVLKRIEDIARDVGNTVLADLLADVISAEQNVRIGRDRTGVGRTLVIPGSIARLDSSRDPWLDRLRVMIRDSRDQIAPILSDAAERRPPLEDLLKQARERRSHDAYHSSSIEGYRLRMEEVSQLLGPESGEGSIDDLASRVAVVGYARAFDALLARIERTDDRLSLSSQLILDLYTGLFAPSVEAGLVDRAGLQRYRNGPVYIRNTMYVPPNADKVPALMEVTIEEMNTIPVQDGMLRGILTHLWFVWAHPFVDGNGRVARFLMNAALLAARHPWLTIRVDQRAEYFRALRRAQIDEEYTAFARFITDSAKHQEAH